MAYSDWNHEGNADSNHSLATGGPYEGNAYLDIDDSSVESAEILTQSVSDSPTEAQIDTKLWLNSATDDIGYFWFRVGDFPEGYHVRLQADNLVGDLNAFLQTNDGNGYSTIDNFTEANGVDPNGYNAWNQYRLSLWEEAGDVRVRIENDAPDGGNLSQIGDDLIDTTPKHTSGGGVGLGCSGVSGGFDIRYDDTEVLY